MLDILRTLLTGGVVLVAAIALNLAVQGLRIMGWYEFLTALSGEGASVFGRMRWIDPVWLFLLYPLLLGFSARAGAWLAERLIG
jgi:hypothetical protein